MAATSEFQSLLFPEPGAYLATHVDEEPGCFGDLNLDQAVAAATAGREAYQLKPFFHAPLRAADTIRFRQEVMRDLDGGPSGPAVNRFAASMVTLRDGLLRSNKSRHPWQGKRWRLYAASVYVQAVQALVVDLSAVKPTSRGLSSFLSYLTDYARGTAFGMLRVDVDTLNAAFAAMRYEVRVQGLVVQVRPYGGGADYSRDVERTFERFQPAQGEAYDFRFDASADLNPIEGQILDKLAELESESFSKLAAFCGARADFVDPLVERFDREVQFYFGWLDFIAPLRAAGLPFCYPALDGDRSVACRDGFDIALAAKLVPEGRTVVFNDFELRSSERIIVVTGPNQGGKTTFARMVGQLHYVTSLGLPVPAREANLSAPNRVLTHFERGEHMTSLRGKLQDDLIRVREILDKASAESVVIINEIFASTSLQDAVLLSRKIAERLVLLGAICVWVTFIEETTSLAPSIVSMASTADPDDPAIRTFKVIRRLPDGLAHALSVARKHRLTREAILERLA